MSEPQPPGLPELPAASQAAGWRVHLRTALPFVATAVVAVALSLLLQAALPATQAVATPPPTAPATAAPAPPTATVEPPLATPTPAPTPLAPDERILAQEILDLRAELRTSQSDTYLLLAALHLADAETALRVNNLDETERLLVTARVALDRAYERAEVFKSPIDDFRAQVGKMREEVRIYPDGMDQRLRRLRQNILSLVSNNS